MFRNRAFSTGVASITLQFFVFFGYVFVIVQYLQLVLDYSPLQAGLALVPMAMVLGGLSRRVPHLMGKVSRRPLTIVGLLLMALGAVLAQLGPDSSYWLVLAGIVPIGAGMALATTPATTDIVAALPETMSVVAGVVARAIPVPMGGTSRTIQYDESSRAAPRVSWAAAARVWRAALPARRPGTCVSRPVR